MAFRLSGNSSRHLLAATMFMVGSAAAFADTAASHDYACSGGTRLTARFSPPSEQPGSVVLTIAGGAGPVTLPQAVSADGGRYVGDGIEFWIKGNGATLTRNGAVETCSTD